jgi:hypothetical protein
MGHESTSLPYFERPLPVALILGSFGVLFVPLLLLSVLPNWFAWLPHFFLLQVIGLGTTHFFITLAVYFDGAHLRHFASSNANRLVYFAVPASLLLLFAWVAAYDLRAQRPTFALYFFALVRFFDFFHVQRQSFGMLQIFKRPAAAALPASLRSWENAFFIGMAMLQWETFASGGSFRPTAPYALIPAIALGGIFSFIAGTHLRGALARGGERQRWVPSTYFVMQACCAGAAAWRTELYLVSLALHYLEYHVIMAPRVLAVPTDRRYAIDRITAPVRARPVVFYGLLLAVVALFEARNHVSSTLPFSTSFLVHIFDGIFVVHYFTEAFLWKFGEPFYRATLGPLYFGGEAPPERTQPRWPRPAPLLAAVAAVVIALVALRGAIERAVIAPLHAKNHLRWGLELARRGDFEPARLHLQLASEKQPDDAYTREALQRVDARLSAPDEAP